MSFFGVRSRIAISQSSEFAYMVSSLPFCDAMRRFLLRKQFCLNLSQNLSLFWIFEYSPKFYDSKIYSKEIQVLIYFLNFMDKGPHLFSISDNTK